MNSEYIIEENTINPLYKNTYRDIAYDLTKEMEKPLIINRIAFILSNKSFGSSPITLNSLIKVNSFLYNIIISHFRTGLININPVLNIYFNLLSLFLHLLYQPK